MYCKCLLYGPLVQQHLEITTMDLEDSYIVVILHFLETTLLYKVHISGDQGNRYMENPLYRMLLSGAVSAQPAEASTSGRHEESSVTLKGGQTLFVWGSQSSLQPQGQLQWPLWLHPRSPGLFTFHCVWYYEPSSPVEGLKFRSGSDSCCRLIVYAHLEPHLIN